MSLDSNPYAAPGDLNHEFAAIPTKGCFRQGRFLLVQDGAKLPDICLISNESVPSDGWRKQKKVYWYPPWFLILILVNFLIFLIAVVFSQKKGKITYSLSKKSRSKIVRRKLLGSMLSILSVGFIFGYAYYADLPNAFILGILGVVILIVGTIFLIIADPIKAGGYRKGWFRLKGCSPEFLDTLPEFPGYS